MFDSRSDHPRGGVHHLRHDNGWSRNRERFARLPKPTLSEREAIHESLADGAPEVNRSFLAHGLRTAVRKREQATYDLAVREGRPVCPHNSACRDAACMTIVPVITIEGSSGCVISFCDETPTHTIDGELICATHAQNERRIAAIDPALSPMLHTLTRV